MLTVIIIFLLWPISIFSNIYFIGIIDEKKMNLNEMIEKDGLVFWIMTVFAPIISIFLFLGVVYKYSIDYTNKINTKKKSTIKECKKCQNRKENECGIYKLILRPEMMCKGNFFTRAKLKS